MVMCPKTILPSAETEAGTIAASAASLTGTGIAVLPAAAPLLPLPAPQPARTTANAWADLRFGAMSMPGCCHLVARVTPDRGSLLHDVTLRESPEDECDDGGPVGTPGNYGSTSMR